MQQFVQLLVLVVMRVPMSSNMRSKAVYADKNTAVVEVAKYHVNVSKCRAVDSLGMIVSTGLKQ